MVYKQDLIDVARSQVGYKESGTNWTIYAKELDSVKYFAPQKKQGIAWCSVFCDWCAYKCIGDVAETHKWLYQPSKNDLSAAARYQQSYFKNAHRYYKTPEAGDWVFFGDPATHVGIVVEVMATTIVTIEGNKNNQVQRVIRKRTECSGFGRPVYEAKPTPTPGGKCKVEVRVIKYGMQGEDVKSMQALLNKYGYGLAEDGMYGNKTKKALGAFQAKMKIEKDYSCGPITWDKLVNGG